MNRREIPILGAVFLDLAGFGMILIDLQFRAERFGADGLQIGLLLGSMFLVQMLVSSRWGRLSDRIGRKPVLLLCTAFSAGGMAVYAISGNLWGILASRVLAGLGAANVAVAQAYLSDVTEEEQRVGAMGRVGAAISAGLRVGPPLPAALAAAGGSDWIGVVATGASGLAALWVAWGIPAIRPAAPVAEPSSTGFGISILRDLPSLRGLVAISVVSWFSLAALEGTFGRLIQRTLGFDQTEFGLIFGYESLLTVVVSGLLLTRLSRRFGDRALLRQGYLFQGLGLAAMPFAPGLAALFLASTLFAYGQATSNPTVNSLASRITPAGRHGELFGWLQSARSVGFLVGPVLGGVLFDLSPSAPYLAAGVICVAASLLVALWVPKSP